jgi:capsular polysaccharide biosynthesis protein
LLENTGGEIFTRLPDDTLEFTEFNKISISIFKSNFLYNYGHCLHDILPSLLYLDKFSDSDVILSPLTDFMTSLINLTGLSFKKVKFLNARESVNLRFKTKTQFTFCTKKQRNFNMSFLFKQSLESHLIQTIHTDINNRLIYCTRNTSSDVKHNRRMLDSNEKAIINLLKSYAEDHNLLFTLFNGQENGKTMTHKKQMLLFREAKIVVGPHGSAMANVIYLNPKNKPSVCEFCKGKYSTNVKHGGVFAKNYNHLNSFAFENFYNYALIPFDEKSNTIITIIDIANLQNFLQSL